MHTNTFEASVNDILFKDESYKIIGACMAVHHELGNGFLEAVYQEALEIEFQLQQIPYKREVELELFYKDQILEKKYQADFICFNEIIIELKALSALESSHKSQVINYLKATDLQLGLLINFGQASFASQRIINKGII